jgi:hypothetical protein
MRGDYGKAMANMFGGISEELRRMGSRFIKQRRAT